MHLAHSMGGVPGLLEILGQNLEASVEPVWLESLHCAPLHPCHIFKQNFQKSVNFSPNLQG